MQPAEPQKVTFYPRGYQYYANVTPLEAVEEVNTNNNRESGEINVTR